ncbi:hypothetical protein RCO48_32965 [Peribacillus frigoritolerans]|nr:hypothetical protein [Peribacillus frigoritolerans]
MLPISIFRNKIFGYIASAGNEKHYLAIEYSLKPLASYLNAISLPKYVLSLSSDYNKSGEIINNGIVSEIEELVNNIIHTTSNISG